MSRARGIAAAKADAYRQVFITHVHELLILGFSRLDRSQLSTMHEPAISGLICQAIANVFDDPNSPHWVDDYEIHDDPPVHDPTRTGKHRRRVDIKIASSRMRPRSKYCFEAKCLNSNAGVGDYLGKEGLGQFISGSYSSDQTEGGMIAYAQTKDCDYWVAKIAAKVDFAKYKTGRGGKWRPVVIVASHSHTYQTIHKRPNKLRNIRVAHVILDCT